MKEEKKKKDAAAETAPQKEQTVKTEQAASAANEEVAATEKRLQEAEAKIAEAEKKADEYKDKWMRSVAEFDNYKKRNANLYREAYSDGKQDILLKVLIVGDNLERALGMELESKTKEGVEMLLRQFNEMLAQQGVSEISPAGEKFDPRIAEAVMQAEAAEGEESGVVKTVFQKGYKLGDKIIRYAKVSVIK